MNCFCNCFAEHHSDPDESTLFHYACFLLSYLFVFCLFLLFSLNIPVILINPPLSTLLFLVQPSILYQLAARTSLFRFLKIHLKTRLTTSLVETWQYVKESIWFPIPIFYKNFVIFGKNPKSGLVSRGSHMSIFGSNMPNISESPFLWKSLYFSFTKLPLSKNKLLFPLPNISESPFLHITYGNLFTFLFTKLPLRKLHFPKNYCFHSLWY